ncbi:MAG: Ldh family oxidoreductase [Bacteroidales bacterium]|jgi:LDH2 family malate/lactate/ureidoglycolate dehydrogenase|nr:Ldh family oxidoreductase [Bacteroidales bacterium]MDD4214895.1 Ldh family oxidoreductase [Bacteroidales bacterium]
MTPQKTHFVDFNIMERFMAEVLIKVGVPEYDAKICAEVLITADKSGIDSHGFNRLKPIYFDRIKEGILNPVTNFEVVRESPATAVVDGHNGMGHVIAKRSMQIAIDKAKKTGMGMVAVRNSTHYGIAGYYALMAAKENMIGITGTNARPSIAPTFGVENMLGTNPLTFGMPTDEDFPFLLDCATSVTQRGKIELYARQGKDVPKGWVIDENGESKTNAQEILKDLVAEKAALAPLGGVGEDTAGYKGYGYAAVVEILSAALQSGSYMKMLLGYENGKKVPYPLGHFFIAIDISAFTEPEEFKHITGNILRELRASKKMPGQNRIYTAGEKEHLAWLERKNKGLAINESLQKDIIQLVKELGITGYSFPFLNK